MVLSKKMRVYAIVFAAFAAALNYKINGGRSFSSWETTIRNR
jgi:hypothetical protein